MRKRTTTIVMLCAALICYASSCFHDSKAGDETPSGTVSYNFQIRPILSDKCFKCHGPDASHREASLRLDIADSAYAALQETKGAFAIVPGHPDRSEVFRRVSSSDAAYLMPPPDAHLGALTPAEQELIRKWISQGAKYQPHWAFTAPQSPPVPTDDDKGWSTNEIDRFVLHKMSQQGLSPNEPADPERLLKRLTLDLTGLPPTLEEMTRFLADHSDKAYASAVDRLLASPQYGEKMAIHWMDVSRYADSYGYQDDNIRTQWPWRDWVIHAFNKNLAYDSFLLWQVAGDMLPAAGKEQILATGFFRNHKYTEEGGVVPEEYRVEYLIDKVKTYGKGFLGVTIECAQCHDHKYDPFSQKDYYSLMAFFNNTKEVGYEGDVGVSKPAKMPVLTITDSESRALFPYFNKRDTNVLTVSVMGELDTLRPTYILSRGRYDAPAAQVSANPLPAVMRFDTTHFPRNRLGLAGWTVSRSNPLTARVFVNQLWQEIFGRGIVKSTADFGMQGDLPSHPELLDWLAVDFMDHGWDIKRLMKQMVMSSTYRQSARVTPDKQSKDPENIYLSHGPRYRLPAELIRDLVLASSGLLVPTIGGPSVKPYQPAGLWEATTSGRGVLATYRQDHGDSLYRRGLYTFVKLTSPPPSMILFDASNRDQCEVKRSKTNTPLQALAMLNDPTVLEASRVLAQNILARQPAAEQQITEAFRRIVCRMPTNKELKTIVGYYQDELRAFTDKKLDARKTLDIGEYRQAGDPVRTAALMKAIELLYNLEETMTKT